MIVMLVVMKEMTSRLRLALRHLKVVLTGWPGHPDFNSIPRPLPPASMLEAKAVQQAAVEVATVATAATVTNNTGPAVSNNTGAASYDYGSEAVAVALVSNDDLQRIFDETSGPAHPQHLGVIE